MSASSIRDTVDQLFLLFEKGAWDEAAKLFSPDAQITTQYGASYDPISIEAFVQNAKHGPLSKVGAPLYLNRKVVIDELDFVETHISQLFIGGQVYELPACIVGSVNEDGLINKLDEYLDPAPIMKALGAG